VGLVAVCLGAAPAAAAETRVVCRLDTAGKALSGRAQIGVANPTGAPLDRVYLWLYPNRFTASPAGLDDVNFHWVYPRRFSPGFMRVASVTVDGAPATARMQDHPLAGKDTLLQVTLPEPVAPGAWVWLEVDYHVAIPERYGGFGCADGACTLMGGFYPMLAGIGARGWDLAAAPAASRIRVEMWVADEDEVVTPSGLLRGPVAMWTVDDAPYAAAVVSRGFHRRERLSGATRVTFYTREDEPPGDDADRQILPYVVEDHAAPLLRAAGRAVELLHGVGARVPPEVTVVAAPLRLELAAAHPGLVVASNRLYDLFPAERFRKFHTRELVRALYTVLLGGGREAEAAAAFLTERFTIQAYEKEEFAKEMLAPLAFIPTVDELIYAPQVAFADAFFGGVADPDKFRDDPRKMMNRTPRGSLYLEKLRDLIPAEAFAAVVRRLAVDRVSLEEAVAPEVAASLHQYDDGYPPVGYRLGERRRVRLPDGRYRWEIDVEKKLLDAGRPLVEPVEVRVFDGLGQRHDTRWDGNGDRGTVEVTTAAPDLDVVEVDARARTLQARGPDEENDPRLDDRDPKRFKLIYNGFGAVVNFSNLTLGLLVDASVRRIYDLKQALRLQLYSDQQIRIGGSLGYTYRYGTQVTANRLDRGLNGSVALSRLSPFSDQAAGTRLSVGGTWLFEDRQFFFEPRRASGFRIGARYAMTTYDGSSDLLHTLTLSADVTKIVTPVDGHTFSFYAEGATVVGDIALRNQLLQAAGEGALRGYIAGEILGRARIIGHVEWRGTIAHNLDWNFGHLLFLRGISAAAFADVGAVSGCSAYGDLFASRNLFASIGMGLRLNYDDLGVQPGMTALDVAVPLALRPRDCLGAQTIDLSGRRPPVMVYLSFLPPL
jgi:hypothetical protein